jgi:hypothetical protein
VSERVGSRWTQRISDDDTDYALSVLVAKGAPLLSPAHDFLDGKLRPLGSPIRTATLSNWFNGGVERALGQASSFGRSLRGLLIKQTDLEK